MRWILNIIAITALMLALVGALVWWSYRQQPQTTAATSAPAAAEPKAGGETATAPVPFTAPKVQAYADLLRLLPGMADVNFSDSKLALDQAARISLPYWAYICPRRDLWISHPDAPGLADAPPAADAPRGVHLCREQIVFVHWAKVGRQFRPIPVFRDDSGGFRVFRREAPLKLARHDYRWSDAVSLDNAFAVPTELGISVVRTDGEFAEEHREVVTDSANGSLSIELTASGFLAWAPTHRKLGVRPLWYSGGAWKQLPEADWAGDFLHLVPFADGSVLQIRAAEMGKVDLRIVPLESVTPDQSRIRRLVAALSDDDSDARNAAHAELASLGPAAWSALEKVKSGADPETQIRIEEILSARTRPLLGRFELIDSMLRPAWRLRDGMVFLAEAGVGILSGSSQSETVTPAWIAIRRGRPIELLPPALAQTLAIGEIDLFAVGAEWVVSEKDLGAKIFFGQELLPLTPEKYREYRRLCGIDRNGRVLLARPGGRPYASDFLLLDPTVADPTPMIQVWTIPVEGGQTGWDSENWPAVQRGQAYALKGEGWGSLKGELISVAPTATTRPSQNGVAVQVAGTTDGSTLWISGATLELQTPDGRRTSQTLPQQIPSQTIAGLAVGDRVFLLHPGGKLTQVRVRPGSPTPFTVDAVFDKDIPALREVSRMWLDPAGRICITTDSGELVVVFIQRQIPSALLDMIPADELKQARPGE